MSSSPTVARRKSQGLCWRCGTEQDPKSDSVCTYHLVYERLKKRKGRRSYWECHQGRPASGPDEFPEKPPKAQRWGARWVSYVEQLKSQPAPAMLEVPFEIGERWRVASGLRNAATRRNMRVRLIFDGSTVLLIKLRRVGGKPSLCELSEKMTNLKRMMVPA